MSPVMKREQKKQSVTFRCSEKQLARLMKFMEDHHQTNRSETITNAIKQFLDYAEQEEIRKLDLFQLVDDVNSKGEKILFEDQV